MKILMLADSLGIGGAETHITELANKLTRIGHSVTVAAEEGILRGSLENAEFAEIYFSRKNPFKLFSSLLLLRRLIKKEKFDIVHAHTRRSALAAKLTVGKTPLVVTAHWVFKSGFPYNILSAWGNKTIAVSNDIKNYLTENYKIYPDNISVIKNGIDTDKFSPNKSREQAKRILHVSRLDPDRSLVAIKLIETAEIFFKHFPNSGIDIVGGGELLPEIREKASSVNLKLGCEFVRIFGECGNVAELMKETDIFIGVSRAALEAMSCGCAVILAGNEGMAGIFSADKAKSLIDTNFCCRGFSKTTRKRIFSEISALMRKKTEELRNIGRINREFICRNYSLNSIVSETLTVYESLISRGQIAVICGCYGMKNFGDDATLNKLCNLLKLYNINDINIICRSKKNCQIIPDSKKINAFNAFAVISKIKKSDIFIFGGGNLLQNQTSLRSLFYYFIVVKIAAFFKKPIIVLSSGIGNLKGKIAKWLAASALNSCDFIYMRTYSDIIKAQALTRHKKQIYYLPDLCSEYTTPSMEYFSEIPYKYFILSPTKKTDLKIFEDINRYCNKRKIPALIIPLSKREDMSICKKAKRIIKKSIILSDLSVNETVHLIKGAEFTITGRLHGGIISASNGVPVFFTNWKSNDKITDFIADISALFAKEKVPTEKAVNIYLNKCEDISECLDILEKKSAEKIQSYYKEKSKASL